jgi:hypothetical protein
MAGHAWKREWGVPRALFMQLLQDHHKKKLSSVHGFLSCLKKPFITTTMPVIRKTAPSNCVISIGDAKKMPAPNNSMIIPSITVMSSTVFPPFIRTSLSVRIASGYQL